MKRGALAVFTLLAGCSGMVATPVALDSGGEGVQILQAATPACQDKGVVESKASGILLSDPEAGTPSRMNDLKNKAAKLGANAIVPSVQADLATAVWNATAYWCPTEAAPPSKPAPKKQE